jgi:hypothetical protein
MISAAAEVTTSNPCVMPFIACMRRLLTVSRCSACRSRLHQHEEVGACGDYRENDYSQLNAVHALRAYVEGNQINGRTAAMKATIPHILIHFEAYHVGSQLRSHCIATRSHSMRDAK